MRRDVLLLGDPALYERSAEVGDADWADLPELVADLRDTLLAFRERHGRGRAIAAPQIGARKRVLYMLVDGAETVFVNPELDFPDDEVMEVMDDCMCFPDLFVKVSRHVRCRLRFMDQNRTPRVLDLEGDLSELLQHEYDHLDGILAPMRALDGKAFFVKGCGGTPA